MRRFLLTSLSVPKPLPTQQEPLMLDALYFAIRTTAPIFFIIAFGILFKRIG